MSDCFAEIFKNIICLNFLDSWSRPTLLVSPGMTILSNYDTTAQLMFAPIRAGASMKNLLRSFSACCALGLPIFL